MGAVVYFGASALAVEEMPLPALMRVTFSDLGAVRRASSGRAIVLTRRASVRTLYIEWKEMDAESAGNVLNLLEPGTLYVRYADPLTGAWRTAEFAVLLREAELDKVTGGSARLKKLKLKLEEV